VDAGAVRHFRVPDTIEGWADAVNELVRSHFVTGDWVEFDYSGIRPERSPLSSGGRAPGHLPLRRALERIRAFLAERAGRKLRPIEWHDVVCWLAEAVLAGGIRRSALISLFSAGDSEMMYAKAHGNFRMASGGDPGLNNQRQMANNSAVLQRGRATREQLERVVLLSREWGDPGFYWTDDLDCGCNPCGEIGMRPILRKLDGLLPERWTSRPWSTSARTSSGLRGTSATRGCRTQRSSSTGPRPGSSSATSWRSTRPRAGRPTSSSRRRRPRP
jgi:ribonucleoside-diphosphate reductase alpha chain